MNGMLWMCCRYKHDDSLDQKNLFFDPNKNRKLAKNGQAYIFMLWYFGEKKGLCIEMAMLPFQKHFAGMRKGLEIPQNYVIYKQPLREWMQLISLLQYTLNAEYIYCKYYSRYTRV